MNRFLAILLSAATAVFTVCTPFQNPADRIEPNKLRPINAVFLPLAEGAPGDTLTVRMYFAGDTVSRVSNWQLSTDDILNNYGTDTVINYRPLVPVATADQLPDSISMNFVIPDSVFYTTLAINNTELNMVKQHLPPGMQSFSRNQLIDFATAASKTNFNDPAQLGAFFGTWGAALGITGVPSDSAMNAISIGIAALFNVFSISGYITCTAHAIDSTTLPIRCQFVIRFNSALVNSPISSYVPVNHNPEIHWMAVVSVNKASVSSINLSDSKWAGLFTIQYLYNDQHPELVDTTVMIDTNHSYFFAADSGITPIPISATGLFAAPTAIADTSTLFISLPQGDINLPLLPGDTISDPFVAMRLINATFYRPKHIAPFSPHPGDTLLAGSGADISIDTGLAAAPVQVSRANVSLEIVTRDFGVTSQQTIAMETYDFEWWFQNIDASRARLPEDSLLLLVNSGGELIHFLPPVDTAMHRFELWVAATDNFVGEINRPVGKATRSATGYFSFTQAYSNKYKY